MSKTIALLCTVIILSGGYWYITKTKGCTSNKEGTVISISDTEFSPKTITVQRCTKVTFENIGTIPHWPASDLHPTHLIYPEFDPKLGIDPHQSWSFVFDRVGTWRCHDHLNPQVRCTVIVTE